MGSHRLALTEGLPSPGATSRCRGPTPTRWWRRRGQEGPWGLQWGANAPPWLLETSLSLCPPRGDCPPRNGCLRGTCCNGSMDRHAEWDLDVTCGVQRRGSVPTNCRDKYSSPTRPGSRVPAPRPSPIPQAGRAALRTADTPSVHTADRTGAQAQGPRVYLAPPVALPSRPSRGPQSSPALRGRGPGTGPGCTHSWGPRLNPAPPPGAPVPARAFRRRVLVIYR